MTEAEQITAALLTSATPPDAIAAMSDQQTAGVIQAARPAGLLIPDDLAVTGWDDAAVAGQLELTTVAQSLRDQGSACAHAVLGENPTPMRRRGRLFAEPAAAANRQALIDRVFDMSSRVTRVFPPPQRCVLSNRTGQSATSLTVTICPRSVSLGLTSSGGRAVRRLLALPTGGANHHM